MGLGFSASDWWDAMRSENCLLLFMALQFCLGRGVPCENSMHLKAVE